MPLTSRYTLNELWRSMPFKQKQMKDEKRREPCSFGRFWANLIDKLVIWIGNEHVMIFEENLIYFCFNNWGNSRSSVTLLSRIGHLGCWNRFKCSHHFYLFMPNRRFNTVWTKCWGIMTSSSFHQIKSIEINIRLASNFNMNDAAVFCMEYISRKRNEKTIFGPIFK